MDKIRVQIRVMTPDDFSEVIGIEQLNGFNPLSEEELLTFYNKQNCCCYVAYTHEGIIGHMIYLTFIQRVYLDTFQIHPDYHRRGIGSQLMGKLIRKFTNTAYKRIMLHCRESNLSAQLFYKSRGFKATSTQRGRYVTTGEDAIVFQLPLGESR